MGETNPQGNISTVQIPQEIGIDSVAKAQQPTTTEIPPPPQSPPPDIDLIEEIKSIINNPQISEEDRVEIIRNVVLSANTVSIITALDVIEKTNKTAIEFDELKKQSKFLSLIVDNEEQLGGILNEQLISRARNLKKVLQEKLSFFTGSCRFFKFFTTLCHKDY